jgi:drug/metabolite transporter (DMT)-like permease
VTQAVEMTSSLSAAIARAQYRRGALLVAGAALAWSSAGLIARTASTDAWTTLFWRSIYACLFLLLYVTWRDGRAGLAAFRKLDRTGIGVAVSFAVSMFTFITALEQTAVADVIIFQAAAPFIAAILGWIWLGERLSGRSLAAIMASVIGILVMLSDSVGKGRLFGDFLSLIMGTSFAVMIVMARRRRDVPMTAATCLATALVALVTAPFASFAVTPLDMLLLVLFGIGQMGLGLVMFTAGVRLMPAADAGLVSTLEVILMPLWVWLVFGEDPGAQALIGGGIVLAAVIAHTLFERKAGV